MNRRREKDAKRVVKSVRTHEKTMAALAPAGYNSPAPKSVTKAHPLYDQEKDK